MKSKRLLMMLGVVLIVAVAAVGIIANSSTQPDSAKATATSTVVAIENFAFSPAAITVKVGTKVTWTNKDSAPHTVTTDNGVGPNSGNLAPGDTYSFTFDTAGTFAYHCSLHNSMTATIIVTQ